MIRTFRYPLKPTRKQKATLNAWRRTCASLYNAALQERRDAWDKASKSITRYDQQKSLTVVRAEIPEIAEVPVIVLSDKIILLEKILRQLPGKVDSLVLCMPVRFRYQLPGSQATSASTLPSGEALLGPARYTKMGFGRKIDHAQAGPSPGPEPATAAAPSPGSGPVCSAAVTSFSLRSR